MIEAIASGRKAAEEIHRFLRGEKAEGENVYPRIIGIDDVDVARFKKCDRQIMPEVTPADRVTSFCEVVDGFSEGPALFEADRCLQCGLFPYKNR